MPLLLRSEEHTSELQSPCNLVCRFCLDRKSTRLNSSHLVISYAVFCLKKKKERLRRHGLRGVGRAVGPHQLQARRVTHAPAHGIQIQRFFFNDTAPTEIRTLPHPDALTF